MKIRFITVILLLVLLVILTGSAQATSPTSTHQPALVYVDLSAPDDVSRFTSTKLPIYTLLNVGLLTGADLAGQQSLKEAGLTIQVLDPDLHSGSYYLAETRLSRPAPDFTAYGLVLLKTAKVVLLRMDPSQVDRLTQAGVELRSITLTPKPLPANQNKESFPSVIQPDPLIQGIIDQVTTTQVYTYDRQLAGELPVWVDGSLYTIPTRYTYSGTPIQKTTSFVGQHMANDLGLGVEYYQWNTSTNPDVIGEISGTVKPKDIFIIGAHIDDVQGAPGADDNASGSVATLLAADILSKYQWGCTLRFAFWTGEEQGLLGSGAYAQHAYNTGENIIGYLNLDMIAWNTIGSDPYINLFYSSNLPPTQKLAQLFADVISAYNINLLTRFGTDLWGSDHNSFWDYGYTSILAIEDDLGGDFNPYYHSPGDTPLHTDPTYFTNFVKSSIATFAHMTGCLIPPSNGYLAGTVTSTSGSALEGATLSADDGLGHIISDTTDASGYYTMTLPAGTYTVTASLEGYVSQLQSASIIAGETTTLDFALQSTCEPVTGADFTWLPLEPFNRELITFTATASGTQPFDFTWTFGDAFTSTGATVTHAYEDAGGHTVGLTAKNACGDDFVSKDITLLQRILDFFLPILNK
jgi:hypothetical protein